MEAASAEHREVCLRCRRPRVACFCAALTPVPSRTRVVFLQHPREAKVPVSTCRMAHLSLPNSELHIGLSAAGNPALEALATTPGVAVLFPSESATDIGDLSTSPDILVVVDGSWSNARKVVEGCPVLSKLPRLKFLPTAPGNYRIRREPKPHCLATIEAAAHVLERLEDAPARFTPILSAFNTMVEQQLEWARENLGPSRHKGHKRRRTGLERPVAVLRDRELVVIFGEVNGWPMTHPERPQPDVPELLQLVAERLSTGERFARVLRPVRPLGPRVSNHLDLSPAELMAGEGRADVMAAWGQFVRPDDLLLGWGGYCRDLLEREGQPPADFINIRHIVTRLGQHSPGSVEALSTSLGAELPVEGGRAMRRLSALAFVTRSLLARSDDDQRPREARAVGVARIS